MLWAGFGRKFSPFFFLRNFLNKKLINKFNFSILTHTIFVQFMIDYVKLLEHVRYPKKYILSVKKKGKKTTRL